MGYKQIIALKLHPCHPEVAPVPSGMGSLRGGILGWKLSIYFVRTCGRLGDMTTH